MTGIIKSGTAVGQMVMPLVAVWLITAYGWRTACLVIGLVGMALLLVAAQFVRRDPPPDIVASQQIDESSASPKTSLGDAGATFAQAKRQSVFWKLCAIQFLFFPTLVTVPLHVAVHGMDLGLSAPAAAAVLSTIAGFSIAGRLTIGTAVDRIGPRNGYLLCLVPLLLSLLMLRLIEAPNMLYVFAAIYGVGHGGLFTIVSPAVAEYFGMVSHGAIFGMVLFFGTIGAAVGPWLAGWVFDTRGSYDLAFLGLATFVAFAICLVLTLRKAST